MEKINWYGAYILAKRETLRFIKVYNQTIFTPIISAIIFFTIFNISFLSITYNISKISFHNFIGYGLIIMNIMQSCFSNSASSFIMSKILGYIKNIFIAPLGAIEIILGFILGATLRGIIVGFFITLILSPFMEYKIYHPILMFILIIISNIFLSQLGILSGILCNSFDQHSAIANYIIIPFTFLSGTFFFIEKISKKIILINYINPFFFIIDSFRYCVTNYSNTNMLCSYTILTTTNLVIFLLLIKIINSGWKIKE